MLDFNTLAEFSRTHCIGICAFLVPANLLTTLVTVVWAFQQRGRQQVQQPAAIASMFALVMILHVYTWFQVGVVMAATYILLSLAVSCLIINWGTVLLHRRFAVQSPL
ncbi:hypothetical protein [Calothrix sp. UHCC 0171]|uniref:hypothetical protein n=1 Tax=Calothrix sp. UHCC 0171 TaxID=3110245 RepID=UPI002B1E9CB9|nr:hypothetical protein [Calothrix sp. UHCC 0171]MEA5569899.1 hypothetical protein [Calothrix sp. UHCC 0171]